MPGSEMMRPDPENRWSSCIWVALAMGKDQLVRGLDTSAFNWRGTHQCYGTPLHAILFGKISDDDDSDDGSSDGDPGSAGGGGTGKKVAHDEYGDFIDKGLREKAPRLALLRVAVESGADPYLAAPESCNLTRCWTHGGDESAYVCYGGLSALECLLAHERAIRQFRADDDWRSELEAIAQAVEILCRSGAQPSAPKIPVMDEIVETWCNVLGDSASADVTIRVQVSGDEEAEVPAHSVVLAQVSPVLKAMLQAGMREGSRREIEVSDCEARALRLFLSLAYTGSLRGDEDVPELDVLVQAIGLAHRWLARHVVQMLAAVLARDLDDRSFEPVADVALRLQLPQLLAACRAYTLSHPRAMRARLQADGGPALRNNAVRAEVERLLHGDTGAEAPQKRRRRAF